VPRMSRSWSRGAGDLWRFVKHSRLAARLVRLRLRKYGTICPMTRWQYKVTTKEGTEDLVVQHMKQMDSDGWELLNGSTLRGTRGIAYTMWWRKTGSAPKPYEEPRPHRTRQPAGPQPTVLPSTMP
jgi:hypothetical protein